MASFHTSFSAAVPSGLSNKFVVRLCWLEWCSITYAASSNLEDTSNKSEIKIEYLNVSVERLAEGPHSSQRRIADGFI
jgi:hypothetical protein